MFVRIDNKGNNPLLKAYQNGNFDEFEKLVDDGVNVNCTHPNGLSLIQDILKNRMLFDIEHNDKFLNKILKSNVHLGLLGVSDMPLNTCIKLHSHKNMKKILKYGIDVNSYGETIYHDSFQKRNPPIFIAIEYAFLREIKIILKMKPDLKLLSCCNETVLNFLIKKNKSSKVGTIMSLLMKNGADPRQKNSIGSSLLHTMAMTIDKKELFDIVFNENVDINAIDNDGCTPLMNSVHFGNIETMMILLDRQADVNMRTKSGMTSVMIAVLDGDFEKFKILVKHGADLSIKDNDGNNASYYLAINNNTLFFDEFLNFFENYPNLLDEKNNAGLSAFNVMDCNGVGQHCSVVKMSKLIRDSMKS